MPHLSRRRLLPVWLLLGSLFLFGDLVSAPRQSVAARRPRPSSFGPAIHAPQTGRLVAEFEQHDAVMLGFNELVQYHPQTLVDLVRHLHDRVEIIGLISNPEQEKQVLDLLAQHNVPAESISFFLWPAISMWVQDFGPIMLVDDEGARVIDYFYGFADREAEDQLSLAFAAEYGLKIGNSRLTMEGGNLLNNGQGYCITTSTIVDQNISRGYDMQRIASILKTDFRMTQWSYLLPLEGEPTSHADMFLTFVGPRTVVLGEYEGMDDPRNTLRLDKNQEILSQIRIEGEPLTVARVPMPPRTDGLWRTYTNVIFANKRLLVPQYPDFCPELDKRALEVYRKLLPDWDVVGIDSSSLIAKRGGLHCISVNLPRLPAPVDAE